MKTIVFVVLVALGTLSNARADSIRLTFDGTLERINIPAEFKTPEGLSIGAEVSGELNVDPEAAAELKLRNASGKGWDALYWSNTPTLFSITQPTSLSFNNGRIRSELNGFSWQASHEYCAGDRRRRTCISEGDLTLSGTGDNDQSVFVPVRYVINQSGERTPELSLAQTLEEFSDMANTETTKLLIAFIDQEDNPELLRDQLRQGEVSENTLLAAEKLKLIVSVSAMKLSIGE